MRKSTSARAALPRYRYLLPVLPLAAVIGCSTARPPRDQVAAADLQVKEALNSKASADAPLDLRMAVEKLGKAKVAMANEHYTEARRLAEESLVDAQVAEAKADSQQAQQTMHEAQHTLDSLRAQQK
ncbi:MAG TPA: DUF4398 domain-containing protein [Candidatus Binatia bacterium]|jgi:hypothetical protein